MGIAREGYLFLGACLVVTLLFLVSPWKGLALVPALLALFVGFFFRDPDRTAPEGRDLILSPADGRVLAVETGVRHDLLPGQLKRVSVFMSPLNVHVNRSPVSGKVLRVRHRSGKFLPAFKREAQTENEQNAILLEDDRGRRLLFVQVAGTLARRIICRVREGDTVTRGERVGMIVLGSRVDLYLPESVNLKVVEGQQIQAGESVVGEYP
jgi:phosphatidylserine decarboxylase